LARIDNRNSLGVPHGIPEPRHRGIRLRWFSVGCSFGLFGGVVLVLALATFGASRFLPLSNDPSSGTADIVVTVDEGYLNRLVTEQVGNSYATGIDGLTLTALKVDVSTANRVQLMPTFRVDAGFFQFDVNARVNNSLSVQDGQLVLTMVGDPQLGDLNVSLDVLPFDLPGMIRQAVDRLNNNLLLEQINANIKPSLDAANFRIDGLVTDNNGLTVSLKHN
jgi:hypothetical protein